MSNFLSRWRPGHLLATWSAHWLGLAAVTLTPLVLAILRATRGGGPPGTANVSASLGDAGISVTVSRTGHPVYTGAAGLLPIALWVAVPPLVLWVLWLRARPPAPAAASEAFVPEPGRAAIGATGPDLNPRPGRTRVPDPSPRSRDRDGSGE